MLIAEVPTHQKISHKQHNSSFANLINTIQDRCQEWIGVSVVCEKGVLYSTCTLQHVDFTARGLYSTRTLQHVDFTAHVLYSTWTLQHAYFTARVLYSTRTIQHAYFTARVLYSTRTLQHVYFKWQGKDRATLGGWRIVLYCQRSHRG